jgi:hypothetical protein
MKAKHALMAVALAGAAGLAFFGDKTPASSVAEAVTHGAAVARAPARTAEASKSAAAEKNEIAILPLLPRAELIGEAGEATFDAKDGPFQAQNWQSSAAAAAAAVLAKAGPPPPPPAPVAPPLPFAYIGKAASDGEWEVFLVRANKTYVVRKNMLVDGSYRIDAIAPPSMAITYLPLNQVQQLNIGVPD